MNNQDIMFNVRRLPARMDVSQVAARLGFQEYEVAILVRQGFLKPLGNPARNGHKWFAAVLIEQCAIDLAWLDKATRAVGRYLKNRPKRVGAAVVPLEAA